ncbi:MAG: pilus assembly protein, partial [Acidimicrobiia bacterium]|nr:pilus assembly protein [Acidimicrobiia bacterium]
NGATVVETAIVFALIAIPMLIGILEFGLVFKDWLTVSHASREGVSVLASAADDPTADITALRAIESAFTAADLNDVGQINIFNPAGGPVNIYTYSPASSCTWSPCPDPDDPGYIQPPWAPVDRNVQVGSLDRATLEIEFTHTWVTQFFGSTIDLTGSVTNQLEPQVFGS